MKLNEIANTDHADIRACMKHQNIEKFEILADGTVDVDGNVYFGFFNGKNFPVNFGHVEGQFTCRASPNLNTLSGSPRTILHSFICANCDSLTSLEGAPSSVGGSFDIGGCSGITSLENFKTSIGNQFYCTWGNIKSGGIWLIMSGAKSFYWPTGPFCIIEKYLGRPEDIFECQAELIEAGYAEYAQL